MYSFNDLWLIDKWKKIYITSLNFLIKKLILLSFINFAYKIINKSKETKKSLLNKKWIGSINYKKLTINSNFNFLEEMYKILTHVIWIFKNSIKMVPD